MEGRPAEGKYIFIYFTLLFREGVAEKFPGALFTPITRPINTQNNQEVPAIDWRTTASHPSSQLFNLIYLFV